MGDERHGPAQHPFRRTRPPAGDAPSATAELAAAVRHHQAGRLREAERIYRQILQRHPRHPDGLNLLGVLAAQVGRLDAAIDCIRQAIEVDEANPAFHYNLGRAYHLKDDVPSATASYRRALALKPDYFDALLNLGNAELALGRAEEAAALYRKAQDLEPGNPMVHNNLGSAYLAQDAFDEAAACFREALRLKPGYAEAHNGLGTALIGQNACREAARSLREALRLNPDYAVAHNNLGLALVGLGRFDEGIATFREALRRKPDAQTYTNLGKAYFEYDRLSEAESCFRDALRLNPGYAMARINLAQVFLEKYDVDAALEACGEVLGKDPSSHAALAQRASALEMKGDTDAAYAIVRSLVDAGTAEANVAAVFGRLSRRFDCRDEAVEVLENMLARLELAPDARRMLHFTLGQLYDDLEAFDEAFRHYATGNGLRPTDYNPEKNAARINRVITFFDKARMSQLPRATNESALPVFIVGMPRSGTSLVEQIVSSHPAVFGAGELRTVRPLVASLAAKCDPDGQYPDALAALDQETMDITAEPHLEWLRSLAGDAARLTDKMPYNFNNLGMISLLFPKARVIHCLRDPLDTCLSCYFQNFARGNFQTFDLGHLGAYYTQYRRLMSHWQDVLDIALLEVRYEELVANQEEVSRRMIAFLGLEWDPRCLHFHESKRVVRTASYDQVRRPIYTRSAGRWRHYAKHLKPLMEALGDELTQPR